MTPVTRIARALGERLGDLDAGVLASRRAFRDALDQALAVADEAAVIEQIVALGGLAGARDKYAVVIGRLRQVPSLVAERRQVADERRIGRALDTLAVRALTRAEDAGALLRAQVERGAMSEAEARTELAWQLRAGDIEVGLAAFERGGSHEATAHNFPSGRPGAEQRSLL